jgi:N-acetylglucosamine kinase-like BadF-type ATPase
VDVLASIRTGPANPVAVGWEVAEQNLRQAFDELLGRSSPGISSTVKVNYAVLAIAGTGREEIRSRMGAWFANLAIAECFCLLPDVALLVAGISDQGVGIALVAGTGAIAWGINSSGQVARTGGWGFFLDDVGGGYWLGQQALQAVVRAADGRAQESSLTLSILQHFGLRQVEELVPLSSRLASKPNLVAELAPIVLQCSSQGDPIALDILDRASNHLVDMVRCTARKLGWEAGGFPLALGGGLLAHSEELRQKVLKGLEAKNCPPATATLVDAVTAAAQLVRHALAKEDWLHWKNVYWKGLSKI